MGRFELTHFDRQKAKNPPAGLKRLAGGGLLIPGKVKDLFKSQKRYF
jgi:hypothetical protein